MSHYILIWSVCTFVESHVRDEISMEELVRQTGFSLAHIRDVFRKCTGKPLSRYVKERRIANAAQELLNTDRTILDITGFPAEPYFPGLSDGIPTIRPPNFAPRLLCLPGFGSARGYTVRRFREEGMMAVTVALH